MSNVQSTQSPAVLVAIDIAKLRHDVLIEAPGWKRRKLLELAKLEAARFANASPEKSNGARPEKPKAGHL